MSFLYYLYLCVHSFSVAFLYINVFASYMLFVLTIFIHVYVLIFPHTYLIICILCQYIFIYGLIVHLTLCVECINNCVCLHTYIILCYGFISFLRRALVTAPYYPVNLCMPSSICGLMLSISPPCLKVLYQILR